MQYAHIKAGIFRSRPNRFIAHVEVDGQIQVCHVKNTGRCAELFQDGVTVYLNESTNPLRKTRFDLIAVERSGVLINVDSQAPNKAAPDYLRRLFPALTLLRPETPYEDARFDFYLEEGENKWFIEVKGVTLERGGMAIFPDAPTQRGVKHLRHLQACMEKGCMAMVLFVVQMKGPAKFIANIETDPEFALELAKAARQGVVVKAVDCVVTPDSLLIDKEISVMCGSG